MASDLVEQYHELAVLALSQPLTDCIAHAWLDGIGHSAKDEKWWEAFLAHLELNGPNDVRDAARQVDVTLRVGRDRLAAHPKPGLTAGRLRRADGRVAHTSRIALFDSESLDTGFEKLRRLNELLPPEDRSDKENLWELARDLQTRGRMMDAPMRREFARAARDIGFELDVAVGATAMEALLEAIGGVGNMPAVGDH